MNKTEINTHISGNVEKLVNLGSVGGDFINNGTIYLVAAYGIYSKLNEPELTEAEFKVLADEYLEKVRIRFGSLNIVGFDRDVAFSEFYVEPQLDLKVRAIPSKMNKKDEKWTIVNLINSSQYIYVQGFAGSGKTTLLKYILANIIELQIPIIPVFITLNDLIAFCSLNSSFTLYDFVAKDLISYGFPRKFVDFILKNNLALLLLDGFDEAFNREQDKRILVTLLDDFGKQYDAKILITSRTMEYNLSRADWVYFQIMAFNNLQVHQFLDKHFQSSGKQVFLEQLNNLHNFTFESRNLNDNPSLDWTLDRSIILERALMQSEDVVEVLLKQKDLPEVLTNPLLLSLLVFRFKSMHKVPLTNLELFDGFINSMIEKWFDSDVSIFFRNRIAVDSAHELIYYIAYKAYSIDAVSIARQNLFLWISEFLEEQNISRFVKVDDIIKTIQTDLGLLTNYNDAEYKFIHLSIQECLVSHYFKKGERYKTLFADRLHLKKNWSQVIRFLSELLIENPSYKALYAECIAEVSFLSPEVRLRLEKSLQKSKNDRGIKCFALVFSCICLELYYKIGERAIYSCQRLAHKIYARTHPELIKKIIQNSVLLTFSGELVFTGMLMNNKGVQVDALILQLFEKYIKQRSSVRDIDQIIDELRSLHFHDLDADLISLKDALKRQDAQEITASVENLLLARNIDLAGSLSIFEINSLTLFLDLIETYMESFPDFGKTDDAYDIFFQAVENPGSSVAIPELPDFLTSRDYFEKGTECEKDNPLLSIELISRAITMRPADAFFYHNRGSLLRKLEKNEDAILDFLTAEKMEQRYLTDGNFQRWLGILYQRTGEYDKAIERYTIAMKYNTNEQMSDRWFIVEISIKLGQYKNASRVLLELVDLFPTESAFYYALAYCQMREDDFKRAMQNIEKAIANKYYLDHSYFISCYCKIENHQYKSVVAFLEIYLQDNPEAKKILLPLLLKCYKELKNKTGWEDSMKMAEREGLFESGSKEVKLPVSPGHLYFKSFGDAFFMENFIIPEKYFAF